MKIVQLYGEKAQGRCALVDDEDYDKVSSHRWFVWEREADGPYAVANIQGRSVKMHKLLSGYPQTDHRNGDGLDNRRSNLRDADDTGNARNRRPLSDCSSPYKGVSRHRASWQAQIKIERRARYLGKFQTQEEAAYAYDVAARELFGEYAVLNFPEAG